MNIEKKTVIVLDNASIHKARKVINLLSCWQKRGLFIFFLPPYSPQLNIAERLWKEIKEGWIKPADYIDADCLFYAINRISANIGEKLFLKFSKCSF